MKNRIEIKEGTYGAMIVQIAKAREDHKIRPGNLPAMLQVGGKLYRVKGAYMHPVDGEMTLFIEGE